MFFIFHLRIEEGELNFDDNGFEIGGLNHQLFWIVSEGFSKTVRYRLVLFLFPLWVWWKWMVKTTCLYQI